MYKDSFNEDYFENIDTEHKAYWLGFLMADGCVLETVYRNGERIPATLQIALGIQDIEIIKRFKKDISLNKEIITGFHRNPTNNTETEHCKITAGSRKMCSDLVKHGCTPRKSLTLKFPNTVPDNLIRHFIRGYFDGDGSVWYSERMQLKKGRHKPTLQKNFRGAFQGTVDFLTEVKKNLENNDMSIGGIRKGHGNIFTFEFGARQTMINFYHYLYDDATIYLERKHYKFVDTFNYLDMAY